MSYDPGVPPPNCYLVDAENKLIGGYFIGGSYEDVVAEKNSNKQLVVVNNV